MAKDLTYDITESIDVLHNTENTNYTIEVNRVSWNKKPPLIDIRRWDRSDNPKFEVGKGVSLTDDAVERLVNALIERGYGSLEVMLKAIKERDVYNSIQDNNE